MEGRPSLVVPSNNNTMDILMDNYTITGIPKQKHYKLTHYQQKFNWDCGVSCIMMILPLLQRQEFQQNFNKICEEEGFGSSTWTIDLCYILRRFHVRNEYFTKTLGIDPSYQHHGYYAKIIDKDEKRVVGKFKSARAHGLKVEQRTVDMETIIRHLAKHGPVILLTNASLLTCEVCKRNALEKFGCFSLSCIVKHTRSRKSYAGHYVSLCGYDLDKQKIYYRNPEVSDQHVCQCSTESMDTARKAFGTDEDIIFIYQNRED